MVADSPTGRPSTVAVAPSGKPTNVSVPRSGSRVAVTRVVSGATTSTSCCHDANPARRTRTTRRPAATDRTTGVVPTNIPSTSTRAPAGSLVTTSDCAALTTGRAESTKIHQMEARAERDAMSMQGSQRRRRRYGLTATRQEIHGGFCVLGWGSPSDVVARGRLGPRAAHRGGARRRGAGKLIQNGLRYPAPSGRPRPPPGRVRRRGGVGPRRSRGRGAGRRRRSRNRRSGRGPPRGRPRARTGSSRRRRRRG